MNFLLTLVLILLPIAFLLVNRKRSSKRLPPGSLGMPLVGQSLSLLWAMRANTAEKWLEERMKKYGPISKLRLFGKPTVFIYGQAANKLVFASDDSIVVNQQAVSMRMILGDRNLLELSGEDHKRVRRAVLSFLKPESLKMYISKMEKEVLRHLKMHWEGKQQILPLMKTLTFNIICSLIFGIEPGAERDQYVQNFQKMIEGMWSVPINIPFTRFNQGLKGSAMVQKLMKELLKEKRLEQKEGAQSQKDLISFLLSIRGEGNGELKSEDEIIHNAMLVMVAGYDTGSVLITFIIRILANNRTVYGAVLNEQDEIAKSKSNGEFLTWEDLSKMNYTWKVALETLRLYPPIFGAFRKAIKDIEYGGYIIPKGWQILWVTAMTHMDNSIFQEPANFDPARFEKQASIPPYCFIPFGGGAHMCPGYDFAKIEILITIHHLVTRFKWKLCGTDNHFIRDPMPVPTEGLPIQISPKELL
ncbi:hypothetical protein ACH5RR_027902 [Cinchona calisaya]|uniref:Cytochrome P450 n=1 Tax=Cinchona calisaya TaxID=153742 RepID=A0ABD2YNL2_9GENT